MNRIVTALALVLAVGAQAFAQDQGLGGPPPQRPRSGPTVGVEIDFGPALRTARQGQSVRRPNVSKSVRFVEGMTALDALKAAASVELTGDDPTHPGAIDAIDGVRTDLKSERFWLLDVNGEHAKAMAHEILLEPNAFVKLSYRTPPVVVRLDFGDDRPVREVAVELEPGMTVLSALQRAAKVELTKADPLHPAAVDSIDGVKSDLKAQRFWLFDVNGQHPMKMAHELQVHAGWEIDWRYQGPEAWGHAPEPQKTQQQASQSAPSTGLSQAVLQPLAPEQKQQTGR